MNYVPEEAVSAHRTGENRQLHGPEPCVTDGFNGGTTPRQLHLQDPPPSTRGIFNNHPRHRSPEGRPFPHPGVHAFPPPQHPPLPVYTPNAPPGPAWFPGPGAAPRLPAGTLCTPDMMNWRAAVDSGSPCSSPQLSPSGALSAPPSPSANSSRIGPHGMKLQRPPSPATLPPPRREFFNNHPQHHPQEVHRYLVPDQRSFPPSQHPPRLIYTTNAPLGPAQLPGPGAVPQPPPPATPCTPSTMNRKAEAESGASYSSPQVPTGGALIAPPSPSAGSSSNVPHGMTPPLPPLPAGPPPSPLIRGHFTNHPLHRSPEVYPYPVPDPRSFPLSQHPPIPGYAPNIGLGSACFPRSGAVPAAPTATSGAPRMENRKASAEGGGSCFSSPRISPRGILTAPPSPSIESSATGQRGTNPTPLYSPLVPQSELATLPSSPSVQATSAPGNHATGSAPPSPGRVASGAAVQGCVRVFSFSTLYLATESFSPSRLLGSARTETTVHSGELSWRLGGWGPCTIAVRRLDLNLLKSLEQFRAEAEALYQLAHPNILPLIGVCHDPLCHVYPRLSWSVRDKLATTENRAVFPWQARIKVALDVVVGLAYLHDRGMIHGDITPGNIHVDARGLAHLANFELARQLDNFTNPTGMPGTAGFLDPEYSYSNTLTSASDIFSVGRVVACLLKGILNPIEAIPVDDRVGQCNFEAGSLDEHARWPSEQAQHTARLIIRCCHRNRDERPGAQRLVPVLSELLGEQRTSFESVPGVSVPAPNEAPSRLCTICFAAPCDTVFRPCSHRVACATHAQEMLRRRDFCPMCGVNIEWYEPGVIDPACAERLP